MAFYDCVRTLNDIRLFASLLTLNLYTCTKRENNCTHTTDSELRDQRKIKSQFLNLTPQFERSVVTVL